MNISIGRLAIAVFFYAFFLFAGVKEQLSSLPRLY
nr:MAG TPA: hypothetical protein [Caudoviricetes sp.]